MSSTPTNSRTFPANTGLGLKLTPSNSPHPYTPRSPKKKSLYDPELSLRRIIGTTVTSPTGFDSLSSARLFAYVAGAAVVVVHIDDDLQYTQRFFRARPAAVPVSQAPTGAAPSTPTHTANDSRNRVFASLREGTNGYALSAPKASRSDWNDSPSSRTWTSRERIKAATCLSISRDGKFLAVGECGYAPRVLIFSLYESSEAPVAILNEHRYGVRAVAFSPDRLFLATLGFETDGFLYLWSIDKSGAAKLHSTNKCTSFIKGMVWVGNSSLVTFGTRHIKTWKADDNASPVKQRFPSDGTSSNAVQVPIPGITKTLAGRNCLLGSLVDATFTAAAAFSEFMAIICSEKGDICLIDHTDGQKLLYLAHAGFDVTCVAVDAEHRLIKVAGRDGMTKILNLDELLNPNPAAESASQDSPVEAGRLGGVSGNVHLCAIAYVDSISIAVDSQHTITVSNEEAVTAVGVTGHRDPILGVRLLDQPNMFDAQFCTWDSGGNILFWDLDGVCKASMQTDIDQSPHGLEDDNQCLVVRISSAAELVILGDRVGCLTILESASRRCVFKTMAHGSEIQDIAIHEGKMTLIASCSRDRTIQLFRKVQDGDSWTLALVQTMDEHQANISNILFSENGERLISCSSDRAIQIREIASKEIDDEVIIAALPLRVITLKATPVSMALSSGDQALIVSLMDRTVATYDLSTGRSVNSFRSSDLNGNDAVIMDALVVGKPALRPGRPTILAGISSLDKSIRIYDVDTGSFLDREWGHTSSVTDVALMETSDRTSLISTATDGTIMIWDLSSRIPELVEPFETASNERDQSPPKDSVFTRPPLRRVLSKAELAEFQRPSPVSTPTGRISPPRPLRRKTSRYSVATQSPKLSMPPLPAMPPQFADTDFPKRGSPRTRSRSPPPSPKSKRESMRRPSLAEMRSRPKSASNIASEFGSLNMATEQVCRTLRAYRKKLSSTENVREDLLKDLDLELRLTAKAMGEKTLKTKAISEKVLAGLLDEYSDRLVSIFDEKLRIGLSNHLSTEKESGIVPDVALRRTSEPSA